MRGSVGGISGKTGPADTDSSDAQILGAAAWRPNLQLARDESITMNGTKEKETERPSSLPERETL
jgi:hypothetical protein